MAVVPCLDSAIFPDPKSAAHQIDLSFANVQPIPYRPAPGGNVDSAPKPSAIQTAAKTYGFPIE